MLFAAAAVDWPSCVVVFLAELNKPFCPRLNVSNALGMCLQAFLVFLGSGPGLHHRASHMDGP